MITRRRLLQGSAAVAAG
ncbi:MAG: twin-arginine translocation signal domain-containing protein, partial [Oceanicoccus sp.]|nr:twin-arginine translocation signal domain-containing protein [Oceanicoccus sp.]